MGYSENGLRRKILRARIALSFVQSGHARPSVLSFSRQPGIPGILSRLFTPMHKTPLFLQQCPTPT